ncbi:hypothetical protein LCGC14_0246430 [marine sediment metagenome]|uniref:Uncharacterized protein n=1 Tax=marine sediment metagenome TaxID=412755 RepID=A0A0F9UMN1_9ZZZZ
MKFIKGEHTDAELISQPTDTWLEGKNAVIRSTGFLSNEEGVIEDVAFTPGDDTIMGFVKVPNGDVIYFVFGNAGSRIYYKGVAGSAWITTGAFGFSFSIDYPISGKAEFDYNGNIIAVFSDNGNDVPRLITVDITTVPGTPSLVEATLAATQQFPNLNLSWIIVTPKDYGGVLEEGAYFFCMTYVHESGNETDYSHLSRAYIAHSSTTRPEATPIKSDNSFKIVLTNLDYTQFRKIRMGIVRVVGGEVASYKTRELPIDLDTKTVTITGLEPWFPVSLEELTIDSGSLDRIKSYTTIGTTLYAGNVDTPEEISGLQERANAITVEWKLDAGSPITIPTGIDAGRSFMPGEVYALYIRWRRTDGTFTSAYHIPGRVFAAGEKDAVSGNENGENLGSAVKVFQVTDTCSKDPGGEYGTLSFWENTSEIYPADFPDFAGEKVRHHKLPSLAFIKGEGIAQFARTFGFELNNIDDSTFDGYQFLYAKRDASKTILGYTIPFSNDSGNVTTFVDQFASSPDTLLTGGTDYRAHPFEYLANKRTPAGTHLWSQFKATPPVLTNNDVADYFPWSGSPQQVVISIISPNFVTETEDEILKIEDGSMEYKPNHNVAANTKYQEEYLAFSLSENYVTSNLHYVAICQYIEDVYPGYDQQILVTNGEVIAGSSSEMEHGDVYLTVSKYTLTYSNTLNLSENAVDFAFCQIHNTHLAFSDNIIALRHEGSEWYKKIIMSANDIVEDEVPAGITQAEYVCTKSNWYDYDQSYSSLPIYDQAEVRDPTTLINNYPYRIYKFPKLNKESTENNWRKFLPADYYDQNKARGAIVAITGHGDRLMIHHERGLFVTRGLERLSTDVTEIYIGSGEIFEREPTEPLFTEEGILGTNTAYGTMVCKFGYVFVSDNRIFILGAKLEEVSKYGKRKFFKDNLVLTEDNPFKADKGVSMAYDDEHERIVICSRENDWTYSYDPQKKLWVSNHVYRGTLFHNIIGMYGVLNHRSFLHGNSSAYCTYYDGIESTFEATVVINEKPDDEKLFYSVNWYDVVRASGVLTTDYTISQIRMQTAEQDTGWIAVQQYTDLVDMLTANTRRVKSAWNHNGFRNSGDNIDLQDRYMKISFKYTDVQDKDINIWEMSSNFDIVPR